MTTEQDWPVPPTQGQPGASNEARAGREDDLDMARGCVFAIIAVTVMTGLLSCTLSTMLRAVQPGATP